MEHSQPTKIVGLPENARRPMKPGEVYVPVVPDETGVAEVTTRSVTMGLIFCALFSMAAAYLALRVGQGIEAAIPIAILAIALSPLFSRRSTILENVIIQSIGANSSHVVSGAVFTIPALYMLAADPLSGVVQPTVLQVIIVSFLGGCLGILFLIPLRYHFMVEMQGEFPWPEGTATTEILLSGESAGRQGRILAMAAGIGALYDGLATTFHAWAELLTFRAVGLGQVLERQFMTLRILNNAAIIGIGYIVGIRYAAIICAGSFLSYFVFVPLVHSIGVFIPDVLPPGGIPIADMTIEQVFRSYVRIIGVGGIAGAGILGIISSLPSMVRSIGANIVGMSHQDERSIKEVPRIDRCPGASPSSGLCSSPLPPSSSSPSASASAVRSSTRPSQLPWSCSSRFSSLRSRRAPSPSSAPTRCPA
jgi:putative OPT family oligopeptide transporter